MKIFYKKNSSVLFFFGIITLNISAEMTQTEAHMSIPENRKLVDKRYNMNKNPFYKKIYNETVAKEKQYNKSHYVFYHGLTNEWRVLQDLYLKLYIKLHPLTMNIENFRLFRWIPGDYQTPKEFLKKEFIEHGLVNDNDVRLKAFLLSCNLALFGNVNYNDSLAPSNQTPLGECTFYYFITGKSNVPLKDFFITGIFDIFDDPANYKEGETPVLYAFVPKVYDLINSLIVDKLPTGEEPQTLTQIFIPKSLADQVAYLSWIQGNPFDAELAHWIDTDLNVAPGESPLYSDVKKWLANVRELFKDKQTSHPLFHRLLQEIEEGKFAISKALNEYKATPDRIPGLNFLQARLLISSEVGNPSSDIEVFAYDSVSKNNKKKYEKKLDTLVDEIFRAILARAKLLPSRPVRETGFIPSKPNKAPLTIAKNHIKNRPRSANKRIHSAQYTTGFFA